jgi:hypothetical protein
MKPLPLLKYEQKGNKKLPLLPKGLDSKLFGERECDINGAGEGN